MKREEGLFLFTCAFQTISDVYPPMVRKTSENIGTRSSKSTAIRYYGAQIAPTTNCSDRFCHGRGRKQRPATAPDLTCNRRNTPENR